MTPTEKSQSLLFRSKTLTEAMLELVRLDPEKEALILVDRRGREESVVLGDLWERSCSIHAELVAQSLEPGGIVVIVLPTSPELISAYFGVLRAGGVPALLATPAHRVADPAIFSARVAYVVKNSDAHSIYCTPEVSGMLESIRSELKDTLLLTPDQVGPGSVEPSSVAFDPDAISTMQYSSGTTGSPKGVLLTSRATMNNLRAVQEGLEIDSDDVSVHWIPLYHDMGLFGAFLTPLLSGCKTVLIAPQDFLRDPSLWLRALSRYKGTFSFSPNLAYAICAKLSDSELEGIDLSNWRAALNGAEFAIASTLEAFTERMKPYGFRPEAMAPAWGMAEIGCVGTASSKLELPRIETIDRAILATEDRAVVTQDDGVAIVSLGPPLPRVVLEIRNHEGQPLPDRHVGEVWLSSDSIFTKYNADPEQTARIIVGDWIYTGDRGYLHDGHFYFVARDKDLIVIGGEKYMPDDVEAAINRVPGVRKGCAVSFGITNEERGTEELAAVVETREEGEAALEQLAKSIREEVTRSIGIGLRYLVLTPPGGTEKTTSGKIARAATRNRHLEALLNS